MDVNHNKGNNLSEKKPDYDEALTLPDQVPGLFSRRGLVKDEAILSRFGKQQRLRVSGYHLADC